MERPESFGYRLNFDGRICFTIDDDLRCINQQELADKLMIVEVIGTIVLHGILLAFFIYWTCVTKKIANKNLQ